MELVLLLAACAEGEDRYIQSLCQTILSLHDVFVVILDKSVPHLKKCAYVKFLLNVYLTNSGEAKEGDGKSLYKHPELWQSIQILVKQELATYYRDSSRITEEQIEFVFDALLPFIENVLENHFDAAGYPPSVDILIDVAVCVFAIAITHADHAALYRPRSSNSPEKSSMIHLSESTTSRTSRRSCLITVVMACDLQPTVSL